MTSKKEFNEIIAKSIVDEISLLPPQEHNQILTFIKNDGTKYMENENGVFIKMNQLKMSTIETIQEYLDSLRKANEFSSNSSIISDNSLLMYHNTNNLGCTDTKIEGAVDTEVQDVEKNKKNTGVNKKSTKKGEFAIEQWKKDVICKMKDDVKQKLKRNSGKQNTKSKTVEKMM